MRLSISRALQGRWKAFPMRLSWINGINNTEDDAALVTEFLTKTFQQEANHFHNPTQGLIKGIPLGDLWQSANMMLGNDIPAVSGLIDHLNEQVKALGDDPLGVVFHLAHSQGALVTARAAKQLSPEVKSRIEVITFGAAQSIDETSGFLRVTNYYATNDPCLLVDSAASNAFRQLGSEVRLFGDATNWVYNKDVSTDNRRVFRSPSWILPQRKRDDQSFKVEENDAEFLEKQLQKAVQARRWNECQAIQMVLDGVKGQIRVPFSNVKPKRKSKKEEQRGDMKDEEKSTLQQNFKPFQIGDVKAEIAFCKPASNHVLENHRILGPTYVPIILAEAERIRRNLLRSTIPGSLFLWWERFRKKNDKS